MQRVLVAWIQARVATYRDYCNSADPAAKGSSLTYVIQLTPRLLSQVHKIVVLNTCYIMRELFNDELHLSDAEVDNI